MKAKKIVKISAGVLAALALILIFVILFWLGPTVKWVAEIIGPKALGTPLTIEKLSINPRKGTITLSGFAIANQESFGNSNAVSLANLDIAIEMASLFSPTIMVQQVQIDSPHFVFEQSNASDNIAEFIQSTLDFAGYDPNEPPKEKKPKKDSGKTPPIVVVQSLEINDVEFLLANTDDPMLDIVVGIDQLSVSMTNGVVQLKNLYIDNPDRLSSKDLFTLDGIDILLDPETIYSAPLTILDVQVHNPHCFIEWATDASSISELLQITEATIDRITSWPLPKPNELPTQTDLLASTSEAPPPPPPDLRTLGITDIQLHLVNSADPLLSIQANLERIDVNLSDGSIKLGRVSITNPQRLATPDLFSLDGINIQIDPATLYTPPLSILDVQVRQPYAFLEANPQTDTVAELMKISETILNNLPTNTIQITSAKPVPPEIAGPKLLPPPPVLLHNLLVDDIQLKLLDTTQTNSPTEPHTLTGIGAISLSLTDGKLQVKNITVPCPEGFVTTNIFHLSNIDISIDPASIFSRQIVIEEIFINAPKIELEQTVTSGNVTELQQSLMHFIPPQPEPDNAAPATVATTNAPIPLAEQPVILKSLIVTNLAINMTFPPEIAATNEPATGPMGKLKLNKLNPMTYANQGDDQEQPTKTTIMAFESLSVEPLEGIIKISNLGIENPKRFANKHLLKLQLFKLHIDPDSLLTDTLVIHEINIVEPNVSYERKITTDNIKVFQEEINKAVASRHKSMGDAPAPEKEEATKEAEGQKVIIEHLLVQGGMVRAKLSALPTAPIPLPKIEMTNIGKEEGGTSFSEASTKLFNAFYDAIIGSVASATGVAGDALKGAGAFTLGAFGNLTGSLEGLIGTEADALSPEEKPSAPPPEEKLSEEPKAKKKSRRGAGGRRRLLH